MISLLLGGLSFLWFFLISFKLGLDEVDPVGAAGDALVISISIVNLSLQRSINH